MKANLDFIAEIGNNHNGCIQRAYRLIDSAKLAGATVAKFQMRNIASLYRRTDTGVEDLGVEYTRDLLANYDLPIKDHKKLVNYCKKQNIEYMCTPWDLKSIEVLEDLDVKRYKIASADFDNTELIENLLTTNKPLIFSTGMSTDDEIKARTRWLQSRKANFAVLHCNSTYPAPLQNIELSYITDLLKLHDNVGYSGHERGIAVSVGAVALGARIIERHLTEDKTLEGPDHQASLLPDEFRQMTFMSNEVFEAIKRTNNSSKSLSQGALLNKEILGKSIVAATDLEIGAILTTDNLQIRSPGQGLAPTAMKNVVGRALLKPIRKHEFITKTHFDPISNLPNVSIPNLLWGVPVRPHDIFAFHEDFNADVYEFHVSYKDLDRPLTTGTWQALKTKNILVHAPELFENSTLLDLTSLSDIEKQIANLDRVCEFTRNLKNIVDYQQDINIIVNIGGFSTHKFRPHADRIELYERVGQNLKKIDESGCNILIQNMAPFPWHFGGQRYQNIFVEPEEIIEFCEKWGRKITLDTSHLAMHCTFSEQDFEVQFKKLLPYTRHLHIADALGNDGEGVELGTGDVDMECVINNISQNQTFIVETWQGHKEFGAGFKRDLQYLAGLRKNL